MKTIGIIGGMSPESTALYYQQINRESNRRLGGNRNLRIVMDSVNFEEVTALQKSGDWAGAGAMLAASARGLQAMGADLLLIATNTMHKVAPAVEAAVDIPLLHVADAVAETIRARGLDCIGLLGTQFTMSDAFYRDRLARHGIRTVVPPAEMQAEIHRIIFAELCVNQIRAASRRYYQEAIAALQAAGAQGVVLGCTEICLLIGEDDSPLPLFDSTALHTLAAVDAALAAA